MFAAVECAGGKRQTFGFANVGWWTAAVWHKVVVACCRWFDMYFYSFMKNGAVCSHEVMGVIFSFFLAASMIHV